MNDKLSVCIPTHKQSKLEKCLDRIVIIAKKWDIAIYICDNDMESSFDSKLYNYDNIFYEKNLNNIGADRNMIKVLGMTQTEYALWLGDDDYILESSIPYILKCLEKDPDLIILNFADSSTGIEDIKVDDCNKQVYYKDVFDFYLNYEPNPIYFGTCIVKTDYLNEIDMDKYYGTLHAYNGYILEYAYLISKERSNLICIDNNVLILRTINNQSWSKHYFRVMLVDVFKFYFSLPESFKKYRYRMVIKRIWYYIRQILTHK